MSQFDLNKLELLANKFLNEFLNELSSANIALKSHWHIDHLCYRTSTQSNYLEIKNQFNKFSKLLIESEVNGRLISTFKLPIPIQYHGWQIDLIEVPAPKMSKPTKEGFEHLEVVCDIPFADLKKDFVHLKLDESGLAKHFNQELSVSIKEFALKFHHLSLESVINVEANRSLFSAIKELNILQKLERFSPLIAGAFPLSLQVQNSAMDILINIDDFALAKKTIEVNFGSLPGYRATEIFVSDEPSLLVNFKFESFEFKLFGQRVPSVKQKAYRHFLIEERLLKIGGATFAKRVRDYRDQGFKTEPAFAKTLDLTDDPYEELLVLQQMSNKELRSIL